MFDLVLRHCRLDGHDRPVDIGVADGRVVAIGPELPHLGPEEDIGNRFVCGGLVETHIHLDKAGILARCPVCHGTLAEAVEQTAAAKAAFTEEDVYERGRAVLTKAIGHGTTRLRTFVEIDPRAGFRSFAAIKRLKADFAHAIDVEICAFAQDGLVREPETLAMLDAALRDGADLVGGCPYTDIDPGLHIRQIFDLADRHGVRVDFHLDFNLAPEPTNLPAVLAETRRRGYGGRVTIGHATQLSALPAGRLAEVADDLAAAGIGVTVLPATDLYLLGRDTDRLVPRGVAPAHLLARRGVRTSIATNNILNPFTPFGDASLIRMANLYANVAHATLPDDMDAVFGMIAGEAARLLGQPYGVAVGMPGDLLVLDATDARTAVREIAPALAGWKKGLPTFRRAPVQLFPRIDAVQRSDIKE